MKCFNAAVIAKSSASIIPIAGPRLKPLRALTYVPSNRQKAAAFESFSFTFPFEPSMK